MDKNMNLKRNPQKNKCNLFTQDPAEYNCNLERQINKTTIPMSTHPKILDVTLDSTHIQNTASNVHQSLHIIKVLRATTWGKQKKTLLATYKAVMKPRLEYASTSWSPLASHTNIQVMQNAAFKDRYKMH